MKNISLIVSGVWILSMSACSKNEALLPLDYTAWIENSKNGLIVSENAGDFLFTLQYKPLEYIVLKEERNENITKETLNKNIGEIRDMQYFTLSISPSDGKSEMLRRGLRSNEEYYQRIEYFSFQMKNDLYLLDGTDSLPCKLFHFERSYSLAPQNNFLLAFQLGDDEKRSGRCKNKMLIYKDRMLKTGIVKLSINKSSISNIPYLKIY